MNFIRMFYRSLGEHWDSIDGYRHDKYLMLVRYIYQEMFRVIRETGLQLETIRKFMDIIYEETL